MSRRAPLVHAMLAATLLAALPSFAVAQAGSVSLSVPSAGTAFPTPTAADYALGYIDNPVALTFSGTMRGPANGTQYTSHVEICALAADLGSGKPLADLLWRPSDLSAPYRPIVQGCTGAVTAERLVGSYILGGATAERKYTSGVIFRLVLRWTDAAASYGAPLGVVATMTSP